MLGCITKSPFVPNTPVVGNYAVVTATKSGRAFQRAFVLLWRAGRRFGFGSWFFFYVDMVSTYSNFYSPTNSSYNSSSFTTASNVSSIPMHFPTESSHTDVSYSHLTSTTSTHYCLGAPFHGISLPNVLWSRDVTLLWP